MADGGTTSSDAGDNYPPPTRPINVTPSGTFSMSFMGQPMFIDTSKPIQGKLVLLLGGICTGVGAGGFDAFVKLYGFHIFAPKTDTCLDGGKVPPMYKAALQTNPNDPEANRQIGDSRMELWDGKPRVNWYSVPAGASIVDETVAAIKYGMTANPHGDWGYFLDSNGSLRTSDVWVVGYSWGSQTWAMISAYVPFGRVITTSGPQAEGFPNALVDHPAESERDAWGPQVLARRIHQRIPIDGWARLGRNEYGRDRDEGRLGSPGHERLAERDGDVHAASAPVRDGRWNGRHHAGRAHGLLQRQSGERLAPPLQVCAQRAVTSVPVPGDCPP